MMVHVKSSLKKYAEFSGTATRAEFWNFFGFFWSVMILATFLEGLLSISFLVPIAYFGLLLPYISCAVRRVRDAGGNGWFILIPLYNIFLLLSSTKAQAAE